MTDEANWAEYFESARMQLHAIAYRMLGSMHEADDVVQDAWLRASQTANTDVRNPAGWLTAVVSRLCLDRLRSRQRRPEVDINGMTALDSLAGRAADASQEAALAESVGLAMLVVLGRLRPAERVAFVLHDMFDVPFSDIAAVLDRSTDAAKKLASRGRHRVRGVALLPSDQVAQQLEIAESFLTAVRSADLPALLDLLAPGVIRRADIEALQPGQSTELRGAGPVSEETKINSAKARFARAILVDGEVGFVIAPLGSAKIVLRLRFDGHQISEIDVIAQKDRIDRLELTMLDDVHGSREEFSAKLHCS